MTYDGWHFLAKQGKLRDGSPAASVGGVETFDGQPYLCATGLHACARALDALKYARGAYARRVRLEGVIVGEWDKRTATRRVILAEGDVERTLHLFACDEAERALRLAKVEDPRSWEAIRVKRRWVHGEATDEELAAARIAARAAARAVVWDARDVAWSAARAAARDAARDVAWSTPWAARDDANQRLEAALMAALNEPTP